MDNANYPIPKRLNLAIAGAHLTLLLGLFWMVGQVESNWAVALRRRGCFCIGFVSDWPTV